MSGAHVLVIEDDEWVARLLAVGLREAGHRVTLCTDGASGITTLHREVPDCVVCDVELPDIDGFAIGRSMRGAGGRVAATPLLFLCARDEEGETKLEALRSGGDAYLSKPFRIDEVAWTVTALVRLAERNRGIEPIAAPKPPAAALASVPHPSDAPSGVLEGDLAKVSIATILTVLEMEKHTGQLEMTRGDHTARLHVEQGNVDSGHLGELQTEPIAVLRTVLTWTRGRFRFAPSKKPAKPMSGRATIGALLMEAARLEDEFNAGLPSRDRRISTLPPVSSRMNDLLGAAFPSLVPEPPPESDPLASPPPPPAAMESSAPAAPAPTPRIGTLPSVTTGALSGPRPNPSPRPFPAVPVPKPSPRPFPAVPAPTPSPRPLNAPLGPPRLPTPVMAPTPFAVTPAAPPWDVSAPPQARTELGVSSLVDDDEWDSSDEPAMSLLPAELQSARGGPPPVPPKRPPTGPGPAIVPAPPFPDVKADPQPDPQASEKR